MLTRAPTCQVRDHYSDSRHWDDYKPRECDIVICTAPKAGTTWTQQIINLLVFQSPEPRALFEVTPWLNARFFWHGKIEAALSPNLMAWLEGGRAVAGDPRVLSD